jgi:hypothetical protein
MWKFITRMGFHEVNFSNWKSMVLSKVGQEGKKGGKDIRY